MKSRTHMYAIILLACAVGFIWVSLVMPDTRGETLDVDVCLIKNITQLPCPSCGSTRAVMAMMQGDPGTAFRSNPLGILLLLGMVISPVWIGVDILQRKDSFFRFYQTVEKWFKNKWVWIPSGLLVVINWIWTIVKSI